MAEYTTVSTGHSIKYKGYLDVQKLSRKLRDILTSRGYVYLEVEHNEVVEKDGKNVFLKSDNDKELSSYAKSRITVDLTVKNCKSVAIDTEQGTRHLQEAEVTVLVQAYVITDYEGRYQKNGWLFFLRNIFEKFIGTREITKFKHLAQSDHDALIDETKRFLNTYNL